MSRTARSDQPASLLLLTAVAAIAAALGGCSSADGKADRADASPSGSVSATPSTPSATPSTPAATQSQAPSAARSPQSTRSWPDVSTVVMKWREQPRGVAAPDAEAVHTKSVGLLNDAETRYGSEKGSKCWPERPTSLTALCADDAAKAAGTAKTSLSRIAHEDQRSFTTLRANADKVVKAAEFYESRSCATAPAGQAERDACWDAGWVVAQAYPLLRDGFNAALQAH
ncbi:hypothetical protein J7F03_16710 [Streptomyces sp. ISL-43]|uniref:hypothetical protein n=1 Tax=Streptomyces sp. ISL-43 TaxID=2819183 RepID=UPI001BE901CD|nr:hypothetical protein [Streptomyces sp. ISL-43]MBT2448703.1 hypothetical protein [Streptomyces sp. ISL-43]